MAFYVRLDPPFEWVRTEAGKVRAFGEVPSVDSYPIGDEESVVGVVSGEWVTSHLVSLPAKTRKQFNAALPYALEESFADDVDDIHFVCPKWRASEDVAVYAVSNGKLAYWRQLCEDAGLPATQLLADYMLLPSHEVADCVVAYNDKQLLAQQSNATGISIDSSFAEHWVKGIAIDSVIAVSDSDYAEKLKADHPERDIRHWAFGERMSHWLAHYGSIETDLWPNAMRPNSRRSLLSKIALPIMTSTVAAVLLVGYFVFDYFSLHREIRSITEESQILAKKIVPEIDFIQHGQERVVVKQVLSQQTQTAVQFGLPLVLSKISPIFTREKVTMQEINYRNGSIVLVCVLQSLAQVESLTRRMQQQSGFDVKLQKSSSEDGKTIANFLISQR